MNETAERFKISVASVVRWRKVLEAKRTRNKPTKIKMEALKRDVLCQYPFDDTPYFQTCW